MLGGMMAVKASAAPAREAARHAGGVPGPPEVPPLVRKNSGPHRGPAFRPRLDLSADDRLLLARLLALVVARAGSGAPLPSARPCLAVLAELAATAAGDGEIRASLAGLTEKQVGGIGAALVSAEAQVAGAHIRGAHLLSAVRDAWRVEGLPVYDPVAAA